VALDDLEETARINTYYAKKAIEEREKQLTELKADKDKTQRHASRLCTVCFYLRRGGLVTHGFVKYTCRICDVEVQHPNGAAPKICFACSDKHNMCCKCMAHIDLES
jgi:hypothetical protein